MLYHEFPEVRRFHSDHYRYLDIAEFDQKQSPAPQVVSKVAEPYRVALFRSRALPVFSALSDWSKQLPKNASADATDLVEYAMELVDAGKLGAATEALEDAAGSIVWKSEFSELSLRAVASTAWLVAELLDVGERLMSHCAQEYFGRAFVSIGRDRWARLSQGKGELSDLVPILADLFCTHGEALGIPKNTTVHAIYGQMDKEDPNPFDLVGFAVALWAATHAQLPTLNDDVLKMVASWKVGHWNVGNAVPKIQSGYI